MFRLCQMLWVDKAKWDRVLTIKFRNMKNIDDIDKKNVLVEG